MANQEENLHFDIPVCFKWHLPCVKLFFLDRKPLQSGKNLDLIVTLHDFDFNSRVSANFLGK